VCSLVISGDMSSTSRKIAPIVSEFFGEVNRNYSKTAGIFGEIHMENAGLAMPYLRWGWGEIRGLPPTLVLPLKGGGDQKSLSVRHLILNLALMPHSRQSEDERHSPR
jgi:hypothetical protein